MAHGSDTSELLTRIANIKAGILHISGLNITSLPDLPSTVRLLYCDNTSLKSLPELPPGITMLSCDNTPLESLPELPSSLKVLSCNNTHLAIKRNKGESIKNYSARWEILREEEASKKRCKERSSAIKEELIMEVMHPRRIEKLLEIGGYELLNMF